MRALALCAFSLSATTALAAGPTARSTVLLADVPFVQQKPDFCGEADVEMALRRLHRTETQDDVFAASGVDPLLGRGAWTDELARALRTLGFVSLRQACLPTVVMHERSGPARRRRCRSGQRTAVHRQVGPWSQVVSTRVGPRGAGVETGDRRDPPMERT